MSDAHSQYFSTSVGQTHARLCGVGPSVIFLHWSPWSWKQYEAVLPIFAKAGYQGVAVDMAGCGQSDFKPLDMAGHGGLLREVVDALPTPLAGIIGGHVGAGIAAEYAIANPGKCAKLIFDGPMTLSLEETQALFAKMAAARPTGPLAGNERTHYFDQAMCFAQLWDPHFEINDVTRPLFANILTAVIGQTEAYRDAYPLKAYRMRERVPVLTEPVLALTCETDNLRSATAWLVENLTGAKTHAYASGHPLMHPHRAAEYAAPILAFLGGN